MLDGLTRIAPGQTLLIDADDTLWENNIYFERAIAAFISYLDHREYTREEVRERLNQVERENTRAHGYGVLSFRRALPRLDLGHDPPGQVGGIHCAVLRKHPLQLFVAECLTRFVFWFGHAIRIKQQPIACAKW